jgi:hypothetical protein
MLFAVMALLQDAGTVPVEGKGLQVLWMPEALAGTSNTTAGFKFRHPVSKEHMSFTKAKDLQPILEKLPQQMKDNGIWISTSNSFLYSDQENLELKALAARARALKIYVFMCELGEQPHGWKKVDG